MEVRGSPVAFILPYNIQFCLFPGLLYWHITVLCYLFGLYPILKEIAGIKEHALPHEINYPCSVGFLEILISCILTYASVSDFYYCLPFIYILFPSSTEAEYFFRLNVGCKSSSQDLNRLAFFFFCFTSTKFTQNNRKPSPYTVIQRHSHSLVTLFLSPATFLMLNLQL